jgi:hypothetical protein
MKVLDALMLFLFGFAAGILLLTTPVAWIEFGWPYGLLTGFTCVFAITVAAGYILGLRGKPSASNSP